MAVERKTRGRICPEGVRRVFWPLVILYWEFLFKSLVGESAVFDRTFFSILLFSLGFAFFFTFVGEAIPSAKAVRWIRAILLAVFAVLYSAEFCVKQYYLTFFELGYMLSMSGSIASDFLDEAIATFVGNLWFIGLMFVPLILFLIFRKRLVPEKRKPSWWMLVLSLLCTAVPALLLRCSAGAFAQDHSAYTDEYTVNGAIPRFGVLTDFRLEYQYKLFGRPVAKQEEVSWHEYEQFGEREESTESSPVLPDDEDLPAVRHDLEPFRANVDSSISFSKLASATSDSTLKSLHAYFGSVAPSYKNQYTGMFEGKNLILICAEAFSHYAVDPEITPNLYRLATEGFQFTNYYQPDWGQSTTGGEFAVLTGLIPTWIGSDTSFVASQKNAMPYSLAHLLKKQDGYKAYAFHDHGYDYYDRDKTHPNLGYDYKGLGNGLVLPHSTWPNSDLEMMQATVSGYIKEYKKTGVPFHTYYMTVSGHANYTWMGNAIAGKNKEYIQSFEKVRGYNEAVQGYFATQVELDWAIGYLLEQLEANGLADDTVIVLTADHYPYNLWQSRYQYSYKELSGSTSSKDLNHYRNGLFIWCGSMEAPIQVDEPCSSIDIAPTLCNLFGLEYDSRLYSGRDILDGSYDAADPDSRQPLVVFRDNGNGYSWITAAGEYNPNMNTRTVREGYEEVFTDEYVKAMNEKVAAMFKNAQLVVSENYYKYCVK